MQRRHASAQLMSLACSLGSHKVALTKVIAARSRARAVASPQSMQRDRVYKEACEYIENAKPRPGLVVLDLDYTIWPFWCEMYDTRDTDVAQLFPETRQIIEACKASKLHMAVASRSPTPAVARAFLRKLGLSEGYFDETLVIPYTQKDQTHFPQLKSKLGVAYEDMLFFDDENGNIGRVSKLGVTSILVSTSSGVSLKAFRKGLDLFARNRGKA